MILVFFLNLTQEKHIFGSSVIVILKKKKTKGSVKSLDVDKQITMIYLKKSFRTVMIKARHKPPTPVISEETDQSRRVLLKELPGIFCESFHL